MLFLVLYIKYFENKVRQQAKDSLATLKEENTTKDEEIQGMKVRLMILK